MGKEHSQKKSITPSKMKLRNEIIAKMTELGFWKEDLQGEIPTYWDNFSNFVIFNIKFFADESWAKAGPQLWKCVSQVFSEKSIALQGKILNNDFRSPTAKVVFGESPWVEYRDNGISYTWNVLCTMFCTGNVSERHRIASFNCEGKVVVDMFAGIGYFTLPYLVHGNAEQVIACEWNPDSVQALRLNLAKNKVAHRCIVLEGDVRITCPRGLADHINLGLIPSCEEYWSTAAEIMKPSGGTFHVHGNVTSFSKLQNLEASVQCEKCLHLLKELYEPLNLLNLSRQIVFKDFKMEMDNSVIKINPCKPSNGLIKWKKIEWFIWGIHTSHCFCEHLSDVTKSKWTVTPMFLHRVKAYAPHIDHLVIDVCCQNTSTEH